MALLRIIRRMERFFLHDNSATNRASEGLILKGLWLCSESPQTSLDEGHRPRKKGPFSLHRPYFLFLTGLIVFNAVQLSIAKLDQT